MDEPPKCIFPSGRSASETDDESAHHKEDLHTNLGMTRHRYQNLLRRRGARGCPASRVVVQHDPQHQQRPEPLEGQHLPPLRRRRRRRQRQRRLHRSQLSALNCFQLRSQRLSAPRLSALRSQLTTVHASARILTFQKLKFRNRPKVFAAHVRKRQLCIVENEEDTKLKI